MRLHGDDRMLALPDGWEKVEPAMFDTALMQTLRACTGGTHSTDHASDRLRRYYDPLGNYAGTTYLDVPAEDDYSVTAADLWAVTTLQMEIPPITGRRLLDPGELRTEVETELRQLPTTMTLPEATPAVLEHMATLYSAVRTGLPPLGGSPVTNQWVLSAKLCARKRPRLFPVRDSKVCAYLSGNRALGGKPGQLGRFTRDIQVFAYLIEHPDVRHGLAEIRARLADARSIDQHELRLLDVVLWSEAAGV